MCETGQNNKAKISSSPDKTNNLKTNGNTTKENSLGGKKNAILLNKSIIH